MISRRSYYLYCDESGSTNEGLFVVSCIQVDPREANRAVKSFRRTVKRPGEVKGHDLSSDESAILFDLAFEEDASAVVVTCDARTACGGWASKEYTEAWLRTEMLVEACSATLQHVSEPADLFVTIDGGRYTSDVLERERRRLEVLLRDRVSVGSVRRPIARYSDSQSDSALQVADVVSNAVFRLLRAESRDAERALASGASPLGSWLRVQHVALDGRRPTWLDRAPY